MRWPLVIIACACGRIAFDPVRDDGALGDGVPANVNRVFVTSTTYMPGQLGGLAGADAVCEAHAVTAGLPGSYVAYLGSIGLRPDQRLGASRGWVRVDGRVFADRPSDIQLGMILHPLRVDEFGRDAGRLVVATGTDGVRLPTDTCSDYTSPLGDVQVGSTVSDSQYFQYTGTRVCTTALPLYCFGIGADVALAPPPRGARVAFVTSAKWTPGAGLADADQLCQTEATAAGLPGTFLALLSTESASALSRMNTSGDMWTRVDGLAIAESTTALGSGTLLAPISRAANGSVPLALVWTGAVSPDAVGAASTCRSWTTPAAGESAILGRSYDSDGEAFMSLTATCGFSAHLYCLQQ